MTMEDQENTKTRKRILLAACELFAEKGFNETTIRDICQKAGVNLAAVNYHFGSKEKLYSDVCKYLFGSYETESDLLFAVGNNNTPEKKLGLFIKQFLHAVLSQDKVDLKEKIMSREMMSPSGTLSVIVEEIIKPRYRQLSAIVKKLLDKNTDTDDNIIRMCCLSIVGQCMYYRFAQPVIMQLHPIQKYDTAGIDQLSEHITQFSLNAIKNMNNTRKEIT